MSTTDDFGNLVYPGGDFGRPKYPGSLDNGATDTEYTPLPDRRVSAQQQQFDAINEAIGKLEYGLEQHIAMCADTYATKGEVAEFVCSNWRVQWAHVERLDALEESVGQIQGAQPKPMMDENGVWISHDVWDELEVLRRFEALVPWEEIGHCLSVAIYGAPLQRENAQAALNWWCANAPQEAAK